MISPCIICLALPYLLASDPGKSDLLHRKATKKRRMEYQFHLKILQSLVETDKPVLLACIGLQDRGKIIFLECTFLPFAQNCSREIKKHLNPSKYMQYWNYAQGFIQGGGGSLLAADHARIHP